MKNWAQNDKLFGTLYPPRLRSPANHHIPHISNHSRIKPHFQEDNNFTEYGSYQIKWGQFIHLVIPELMANKISNQVATVASDTSASLSSLAMWF